jgi:heme/copper-type cytochrome/quinol oxidase subunit 2
VLAVILLTEKGTDMSRYKLDYFAAPHSPKVSAKQHREWIITWVASLVFIVFALLFFGGVGTAFRYRSQHQTLRKQHDMLRLRYDSLYAAKLQADKQLGNLRNQLQSFQKEN